jgi:hypothetical protein
MSMKKTSTAQDASIKKFHPLKRNLEEEKQREEVETPVIIPAPKPLKLSFRSLPLALSLKVSQLSNETGYSDEMIIMLALNFFFDHKDQIVIQKN